MKTITVTIPEVNIKVDAEGLTFDTLENMLFDIAQQLSKAALEKAIADLDALLKQNRPKGVLENLGKKAKYLITRFGDIRYLRTRYKDTQTGKGRYLTDEVLKLQKNQRVSLTRNRIETYLASLHPYRAVVEQVELISGSKRSHESIKQLVVKEGQRIIGQQKKTIEKINSLDYQTQPAIDTACLEADSTYIRLQKKGLGFQQQKKYSLAAMAAIG